MQIERSAAFKPCPISLMLFGSLVVTYFCLAYGIGVARAEGSVKTPGMLALENLQIAGGAERIDYAEYRRFTQQNILEFIEKQRQAMTPEQFDKYRKEMMTNVEKDPDGGPPPSEYEEPSVYEILRQHAVAIEAVIAKSRNPLKLRPIVGSLPVGPVNAMTFRACPSLEYVVAFQRQLLSFALLFSKAVVFAFPRNNTDPMKGRFSLEEVDWRKRLKDVPDIKHRFRQVFLAYLLYGEPARAPQYFLDEPYNSFAVDIMESMERFIMGHEYGHIVLNHVPDCNQDVSAEASVDELMTSQEQELEADAYGLFLAILSQQDKKSANVTYGGADLFLTCLDVIERGIAVLMTGQENVDTTPTTHPSAHDRRTALRAVAPKLIKGDPQRLIALGSTTEAVVEELWKYVKGHLVFQRELGRTLSPIFGRPENFGNIATH
jgi:hypothetical protein